jgi:hypothetical protein
MINGDYFKGIFTSSRHNINDELINKKLKDKGWSEYGFYDDCWYYLKNNELFYSYYKPTSGNEITYGEFEDWILGKQPIEPIYEIY